MNNKLTSKETHSHYNNNFTALELLYDAFREYGIPNPMHIKNSGFTRWGKNGRYWLTAYREGYCFGDFVNGFSSCVFLKKQYNKHNLWKKLHVVNQAAQTQRTKSAEQREQNKIVAQFATQIWKNAKPCENHPYLQKKGIEPHDLKISDDGRLIIPAFSYDNQISTLQYINSNGEKRFLKDGMKQGCFYPIGKLKNRILLCEGYATAYSIHEATKELTICCFDAGNLIHVAAKFRDYYPDIEIVICA